MLKVEEFNSQFDRGGRYTGGDGEIDVVFRTTGNGKFPGKLRFTNGLLVRAEMDGASPWAYPDNSPLNDLRIVLDFENEKAHGVFVDHGRVLHQLEVPERA